MREFTQTRSWTLIITLLIVTVVTLNLNVLIWTGNTEWLTGGTSMCERPVLVKFDMESLGSMNAWRDWQSIASKTQSQVVGLTRKNQNFLAIAIPTWKASHAIFYLEKTLSSLTEHSSLREQLQCTILVFLLDEDIEYNNMVFRNITAKYMYHIDSGFLQIIQVPQQYYQTFIGDSNPALGNRSPTYVRRLFSKEAADFTYMYRYGHATNQSRYFLQLSDDVVTMEGYIDQIKQLIFASNDGMWAVLELTNMEFVGSLFNTRDLAKLADTITMFYDVTPMKNLLALYSKSMAQPRKLSRKAPLFEHIGSDSRHEGGSSQRVIDEIANRDRYLNRGEVRPDNPAADITTNMTSDPRYTPRLAYEQASGGFFWGQSPKAGDWFLLTFHRDIILNRVIVNTGTLLKPDDFLRQGRLSVAPAGGTPGAACQDYRELGRLDSGHIDVFDIRTRLKLPPIRCLKLEVVSSQDNWIVIDNIYVFSIKT